MSLKYDGFNGTVTAQPKSRAFIDLSFNYALFALVIVCVSARILVKTKLRKLGREDVLILISTSLILQLLVLTTVATKYGFGTHTSDFRPEWKLGYGKISYAMIVLSTMSYPFTKVSMLCFYIRLGPHRTFATICYVSMGYILATSTALTFIQVFRCTPISHGWDRKINSKCIDPSTYVYTYRLLNVFNDILLMVLPIPILLRMQMKLRIKLAILAMFSAGILITGVSLYSVYLMYRALHGTDVLWDGAKCWTWALAEANAGVLVACMPSMLILWNWIRGAVDTRPTVAPGTVQTIGGGARKIVYNDAVDLCTMTSSSESCPGGVAVSTEMLRVSVSGVACASEEGYIA